MQIGLERDGLETIEPAAQFLHYKSDISGFCDVKFSRTIPTNDPLSKSFHNPRASSLLNDSFNLQ